MNKGHHQKRKINQFNCHTQLSESHFAPFYKEIESKLKDTAVSETHQGFSEWLLLYSSCCVTLPNSLLERKLLLGSGWRRFILLILLNTVSSGIHSGYSLFTPAGLYPSSLGWRVRKVLGPTAPPWLGWLVLYAASTMTPYTHSAHRCCGHLNQPLNILSVELAEFLNYTVGQGKMMSCPSSRLSEMPKAWGFLRSPSTAAVAVPLEQLCVVPHSHLKFCSGLGHSLVTSSRLPSSGMPSAPGTLVVFIAQKGRIPPEETSLWRKVPCMRTHLNPRAQRTPSFPSLHNMLLHRKMLVWGPILWCQIRCGEGELQYYSAFQQLPTAAW